jgi:Uma2 family endonuclease
MATMDWWIFGGVDVALGPHDVVRPDLAGWKRERLERPGAMRPIAVAPDWVCEVISRSTAVRDRVTKPALYARSGVTVGADDALTGPLAACERIADRCVLPA